MSTQPSITLVPASVTAGNKVSVTGTGFTPNSSVAIQCDNMNAALVPPDDNIKTTQDGKFFAYFYAPKSVGQHTVKAVVDVTSATATIMVDDPMRLYIRIPLVAYYLVLMVTSGYLLVYHWQLADIQNIIVKHPEIRYVLLAGLFGLMGASIHGISSLTVWAGNQKLAKSWGWWYLMHPPTGAILAILIYVVLRAGLISGDTNFSYYGVAALSALAGLSTKNTMAKLRDVFDALFGAQDAKKNNKAEDKPQT